MSEASEPVLFNKRSSPPSGFGADSRYSFSTAMIKTTENFAADLLIPK